MTTMNKNIEKTNRGYSLDGTGSSSISTGLATGKTPLNG
jgi:hypothetical protein